jgi:hypothetical protein
MCVVNGQESWYLSIDHTLGCSGIECQIVCIKQSIWHSSVNRLNNRIGFLVLGSHMHHSAKLCHDHWISVACTPTTYLVAVRIVMPLKSLSLACIFSSFGSPIMCVELQQLYQRGMRTCKAECHIGYTSILASGHEYHYQACVLVTLFGISAIGVLMRYLYCCVVVSIWCERS